MNKSGERIFSSWINSTFLSWPPLGGPYKTAKRSRQ